MIVMETLIMTWVHIWNTLLLEYHVMGLVDLALSSIFITSSSLSLLLKIIVLSLLIRGLDKNLLLVIFCIAKATYNNIELLLVTVRVDIVWLLNILNVVGWGLMIWLEGPICIPACSCRSVCSIIILKWLLLLQLTGSACGWHQDWRILERVNKQLAWRVYLLLRGWINAIHWATTHRCVVIAILHNRRFTVLSLL